MADRGAMEKSIQETSLPLSASKLAGFCSRWQISALELYGSGSRGELEPDSDLDFLVTFRSGADWSLFDHVRMKRELESLTGRHVDLMTRRALERSHNWLLREEILGSARVVFSEAGTRAAAQACRSILEFIHGMDREAFLEDLKTRSAVLHQLLVVGEATKRLSQGIRDQQPEIPWADMAGMRDVLIHGAICGHRPPYRRPGSANPSRTRPPGRG